MRHWRNWTRTISTLFTYDGVNLYEPLQNWLTTGTESQHWISYRDPKSNNLYLQPTQQGQQWMRYKSTSPRKLIYNPHEGTTCNPPAKAVRISLQSETTSTWIYTDSTTEPRSISHLMPTPPDNIFLALERIVGNNTSTHGEERIIAQSLQAGTLQGASDGSMAHNRATQAWRIEPQQTNRLSQHYIQGAGPVDGDPHTLDSTTAERGGFLGPLWFAYQLAHKYTLDRGAITMHIDNISSFTAGDPP